MAGPESKTQTGSRWYVRGPGSYGEGRARRVPRESSLNNGNPCPRDSSSEAEAPGGNIE